MPAAPSRWPVAPLVDVTCNPLGLLRVACLPNTCRACDPLSMQVGGTGRRALIHTRCSSGGHALCWAKLLSCNILGNGCASHFGSVHVDPVLIPELLWLWHPLKDERKGARRQQLGHERSACPPWALSVAMHVV